MSSSDRTTPSQQIARVTRAILDPANRELGAEETFTGVCEQLQACGLSLLWCSTSIQTMNPEVAVQNLRWHRERGLESYYRRHELLEGEVFQRSPIAAAYASGSDLRVRLDRPEEAARFPITAELAAAGGTDYLLLQLELRRARTFMSFVTDREGGFSDAQLELLEGIAPVLRAQWEILSLNWSLTSLLRTYLGRNASNRVLAGSFKRGTGERIRALIWMSDLRGFTRLVDGGPIDDVLESLDQYFSCLARPLIEHDGEVLKFIGDAVLGIFPIADQAASDQVCDQALRAASRAFAAMTELNRERRRVGRGALEFGLVLHAGEVTYGNIGTAERLDFTVIGPAVNEASRIESLCKSLGQPFLITEAFAALTRRRDLESLGRHVLRGVEREVEIYTAPGICEPIGGRDPEGSRE